MKELSPEEKWKRCRAALSMLLGTSLDAVKKRYGRKGLEIIAQAWEENNQKAARRLMELVGEEEASLATVAKIIDFTDAIYGVEREWKEITPTRAVKIETKCPIAKNFPEEMCTLCFASSMQGIAKGVTGNPKVRCRMPKSIPNGDGYCEIILEMAE